MRPVRSVGCKPCSSSKKLRGLCARTQARQISTPILFLIWAGYYENHI